MTVFRAATLRTFFFAFHAGAKELMESDPNLALELFMNDYYKVFDACFPLTNPRPNTHSSSWFDKDFQVLMYEKEKLFKKYVNKKTLTA